MSVKILFLASFVALSFSATKMVNVPIIQHHSEHHPNGSYNYAFETGNFIYVEEQGFADESKVAQGQYQYQSPDGRIIRVVYIADETGFHPQGEHLPTPPPIPEAILKSLNQEILKDHPQ